jgi:eukaryotic-like serine/threonine-protein kinase
MRLGTRLGAYEITGALGAGGMGEVYRAHDSRLGRDVALKILPGDRAADPALLDRFTREARAVAALTHPHIVTLYSTEEADGVHFLTMELVTGRRLDELIPRGGMAWPDFFDVALALFDALSAAHGKDVVHRDLKPANIMVGADGRVKVLDFGLARFTEPLGVEDSATRLGLTADGTILGTMPYMSPEQIEGRAVDHRTDLFSLGVVLYEMATGQRPFSAHSSAALMSAILRDVPPPVDRVRADTPAGVAALISQCLDKSVSTRVQTARGGWQMLKDARRAFDSGSGSASRSHVPSLPSIAVLPFADMSPGHDQEWLCDGIAEEILNVLAQVQGIRVTARTSAFAFKGKNEDIRHIAAALGVQYVLEGSVRRAGDRIRVTAQLVAADDGSRRCSHRYDRGIEDVFAVQDEIAGAIAQVLKGTLLPQPVGGGRYVPAIPAYEELLRGRHQLFKFTRQAWDLAREHFERAIALDSGFAAPHVDLAFGYFMAALFGILSMRDAAPAVRVAVARVMELEPLDPSPRFWLGAVALAHDYDWAAAEAHFRAALSASRASAEAHWVYASLYIGALGHFDASVSEMKKAIALDPLNPTWHAVLSAHLVNAVRPADALESAKKAVELDEHFFVPRYILGEAYLAAGKLDEAINDFEHAHRLAPWHAMTTGLLAAALMRAGNRTRAVALMEALGSSPRPVWGCVVYHLHVGELDEAANWYQVMIDEREPFALVCANAPVTLPLHAHPRWQALAAQMRLPAAGYSPLISPVV